MNYRVIGITNTNRVNTIPENGPAEQKSQKRGTLKRDPDGKTFGKFKGPLYYVVFY
jgi:hypothetical protein